MLFGEEYLTPFFIRMLKYYNFGRATVLITSIKWEACVGISQLNVIKTDKRTLLTNESLDDLFLLTTTNVPLKEFCPDNAIDIWWKDKICKKRKNKQVGVIVSTDNDISLSGPEVENNENLLLIHLN